MQKKGNVRFLLNNIMSTTCVSIQLTKIWAVLTDVVGNGTLVPATLRLRHRIREGLIKVGNDVAKVDVAVLPDAQRCYLCVVS